MKKLIVLMLAMLCAAVMMAQNLSEPKIQKPRFSIDLGPTLSKWGGEDYGADFGYKLGYHIGGKVRFPVNNKVWIEPGLSLSTKGAKYSESESGSMFGYSYSYSYEEKITSTYLDLPIQFRYYLDNGINFYGGPQVSFLLSNKYNYEETECFEGTFDGTFERICDSYKEEDSSTEGYKDVDLSLQIGLAYQLKSGLNLSMGYGFGVLSIDEDGDSGGPFNRQFKFSIGYDLNFGDQ